MSHFVGVGIFWIDLNRTDLGCWRLTLTTTVPLGFYIRKYFRFLYYASLSTCCQNLEKNWSHRKNLGKNSGLSFKGSDREKC